MKMGEWLFVMFAGIMFLTVFFVMTDIGSETMRINGIVIEKSNITESGPFIIIHDYDENVTYNVTSMSAYSEYDVGDYTWWFNVPEKSVSYIGDIHEIPLWKNILFGMVLLVVWLVLVLLLYLIGDDK